MAKLITNPGRVIAPLRPVSAPSTGAPYVSGTLVATPMTGMSMSLMLHVGMATGMTLGEAVDSILSQLSINHADRVDLALAVMGWPLSKSVKEVAKIARASGAEDDVKDFAAILDAKGVDQEMLEKHLGITKAAHLLKLFSIRT